MERSEIQKYAKAINTVCCAAYNIEWLRDDVTAAIAITLDQICGQIEPPVKPACGHKRTRHKKEPSCHPYGDSCEWDECIKCGIKLNFKINK